MGLAFHRTVFTPEPALSVHILHMFVGRVRQKSIRSGEQGGCQFRCEIGETSSNNCLQANRNLRGPLEKSLDYFPSGGFCTRCCDRKPAALANQEYSLSVFPV